MLCGVHRGQHSGCLQVKGIPAATKGDTALYYSEQQGVCVCMCTFLGVCDMSL